jgi:TPR repeat protein
MPDIFISYKKEERPTAALLATRLTEAGYDVWWDAALLAGDRFEDEIASVLGSSHAVIILWSKKAIASDWVKAEAETARAQKKALPAVIDELPVDELPLLFRGIHTVRLQGWSGEADHAGYTELMASVVERLGNAAGPELSPPQAEAKLAQSAGEAEVWAAIAESKDPSAAEYRAYLKQFGTSARFAELARIRVARLEQREMEQKGQTAQPMRVRRNWLPAIALPLVALLIIAGVGGWLWQHGDLEWVGEMFISQDKKDMAQACAHWSKSAELEWPKTLPGNVDAIIDDCETAEETWPDDGDYKAMLAMVRVVQGHTDQGMTLARKSIEQNSALGNYLMGVMYDYAIGVAFDLEQAAAYYQAAYALGSADAAGRLCFMAEDHDGALPYPTTKSAIYALCTASSDMGSAIGQAMMGYIWEYGDFGKPIDDIKALEFYSKSAEQGNPFAKVQLGALLIRGIGVKHDPSRAVTLFEDVVELGYPEAMRWLGIAHELGVGVEQDIPRAGQLYDQADRRGDTVATLLLGFTPHGGNSGYFIQREFDRLATDQTTVVGRRILAAMQQFGLYAPQNSKQSFATLSRCVDTSVFCQLVTGLFRRFVPGYVDGPLSVEMFERAAASGEMHAQYQLGNLYERGDGVPLDLDKAREYYRLAVAQGLSEAAEDLARLN